MLRRVDDPSFSKKSQKVIGSLCDHDLADHANKKSEHSILENDADGQLVVHTHGAENVSAIAESKIQSRDSQAVTDDHEEQSPDTSFAQITNDHCKSMKRPVDHRIGTALFMAADLYGHEDDLYSYDAGLYNHKGPPSYRYDLESFFLTFAWTCATFDPLDDMPNRSRKFLKELKALGRSRDIRYGQRLTSQTGIYADLARDLSGPYSHVFKECIVPRLVLSDHLGHIIVTPFFDLIFLHLLGEMMVKESDKELEDSEDLEQQKKLGDQLCSIHGVAH